MITRQLGKLVRGSATPFQILAASVIASCLAFIPGFAQAPGLILCWVVLLVVLNANLFLAGVVGVAAKLVALLLAPVSFAVGRFLMEGPARGLIESLVNAPVFAWFGFEYFLVTGGQAVGLLFGVVVGVVLVNLIRGSWRKLAALEQDSAAYQTWMAKPWVKVSSFVFVGGVKGKSSYEQLLARRFGNPVRVLGLVLVVLLGVLTYVGAKFFDDTIITALLRSGLERANGATVDLERAELDPVAGRLTLHALALCDPDALTTNLFTATTIEAKVSTSDLLRKRATVDTLTVVGATQGAARLVPGTRHIPPADTGPGFEMKLPDMQSIEDVLKNADVWKERLATARRWLERFSGAETAPESTEGTGPTYEEILRERVRLLGYAGVTDETLVRQAPTLLIRHVEAGDVGVAAWPDEKLAIVAENLSTHPRLAGASPRFAVNSASGKFTANLVLDALAQADALAQLELTWKGLSVDALAAQLKSGDGAPPVSGGTLDVSAKGLLSFVDSNLPLTLTLHDTNLNFGGSSPTRMPQFPLTVAVRGPIDNPVIRVDKDAWEKALVSAGKKELTNRLQSELQKRLGGDAPAGTGSGEPVEPKDAAKSLLEGFLNKKKPAESEKKPEVAP